MKFATLINGLKKEAASKPIGDVSDVIEALEEFETAAVFIHESELTGMEKVEKVQKFARETFVEIYPTIHALEPEKAESLLDTVLAKNADYGNSFGKLVDKYGDVAMSIRISDKLSRLKNLTAGNKRQVNDEPVEDSLLDVAGYLTLILSFG